MFRNQPPPRKTPAVLRVLTLSTLFPDASRPNFGVFVERQCRALAALPDVALSVVAPVGLPPWPLSHHPRWRALAGLPARETWRGSTSTVRASSRCRGRAGASTPPHWPARSARCCATCTST